MDHARGRRRRNSIGKYLLAALVGLADGASRVDPISPALARRRPSRFDYLRHAFSFFFS